MAYTSVPITIKDAASANQQMQAYSDGTNSNFTHSLLDNKGNLISPAIASTVRPTTAKTRPANTTAYAAGQVMAESTSAGTVWTFANCARINQGTGTITSAELADSLSQVTHLQANLYLFSVAPTTTINDAQVWAPTYAELQNCVGVLQLISWYGSTSTSGASILASYDEIRKFVCAAASTTLYGVLVATNAYTPGNAETLNLTLGIEQD